MQDLKTIQFIVTAAAGGEETRAVTVSVSTVTSTGELLLSRRCSLGGESAKGSLLAVAGAVLLHTSADTGHAQGLLQTM